MNMLENFPTAEKVKPTHEVMRADFESKEKAAIKKGTDFLENLEPEKFNKRAANWLLALSLFAGASTAFAGEQNVDKDNLPSMGEDQISKTAEKNKTADFDWKKIVGKIEISMGAKSEEIKKFSAESIDYGTQWKSEFYNGMTATDMSQAISVNYGAVSISQNSSEFFQNLPSMSQKGSGGFTDQQKAISLQQLGTYLGSTYDYDMLAKKEYVSVSDDKMFQALKESYTHSGNTKSGICGNIHTFLTKTAGRLGVEAWLQSGATLGGAHAWSGMVLGDGAEKQIVFLDYGTLVPTGTLDYKDALGVMERNHKAISVFNNFVGSESEALFPVRSRAGEVIEEAAGVEGAMSRLESNFGKGDTGMEARGVEIKISPEIKEIKLNSDSLGLTFFKFEDSANNPYQSLEDLSAWRASARLGNEKIEIEGDATVLHMNIKDLYGGAIAREEAIGRLAVNYVDKKQLTKNEYGEYLANFGFTFESAMKTPIGERKSAKDSYRENKRELAVGGGVIYIDPNDVGKFYIRAEESFGDKSSDFQTWKSSIKETAKNFVVGGEVKVYEGEILNMEIAKSNLAWGSTLNIKGGIEGEVFKGNVGYEKKTSDYERFGPSSEKIEFGVTYKGGPKWEVDVIGAKTTEKYRDAQSNDVYNAEVKLKIFLW